MESFFGQVQDEYDLVFDPTSDDPIRVNLLRQGASAKWDGTHQPSIDAESFRSRPMSYRFKNGGAGAGHSIRTAASTGASQGGALTALGYSYGEWITTVVPGIVMPSGGISTFTTPALVTTGTIVDGISYGGHYYLTTNGRYLIKIADENGATSAIDLGVGYTGVNLVVFKGYLWISGQGSGTIRRFDGTTIPPSNGAAGTERSRLAVVSWTISPQIATGGAVNGGGTNAMRLIGTNAAGTTFQHVADTADPLVAADWSGSIKICDTSYGTQWICSNNHVVWFATQGGVLASDETGYTPNITEWVKLHYNASNGGQALYFNGVIWYAHESGLVVMPTSGDRQDLAERWAQFGYMVPNQTPIYGRPRALAPGGDCLWVGYVNTTSGTSYVMRLMLKPDGSVEWSGPEAVFANETVSMIRRVTPASGVPYLLIATQVAGGASPPKFYRQDLPVSGNPYVDWANVTGYTSATASTLFLSREDYESGARKVAERYAVVAQNLSSAPSATRSIAVYASADDGAYTLQGTSKTSIRRTFLATSGTTSATQWKYRLNMVGTATQPWILEAFEAAVAVVPDQQTVRTYPVIIYARQATRTGSAEELHDPYRVWRRLEGLQRKDRVLMRYPWGETITVRVEQAMPHAPVWDQKLETWVLVGTVTVRTIIEPARYRAGRRYSDGERFGLTA